MKKCLLENSKICDNCGECGFCEFDDTKICDNCMKCVTGGKDEMSIAIDKIIMPHSQGKVYKKK